MRPDGGCVLTIGNFDGVHRGHQALLQSLSALARRHDLPCTLLTFEPHPAEVLYPQQAPARLTRFREKMHALRGEQIDRVVCARFDSALAGMEPRRFIDEVLVSCLGVKHLLVGDDFRFGQGGRGDHTTLSGAAREGCFALSRLDTVSRDEHRVSSTRIREQLAAGDLRGAAHLLGRPYTLCGRVSRGQRLGRTIGFPTANLPLRRDASPLSGVFAVSLLGADGGQLHGVANVGRRPTVGGTEERVEVHVFDFDGDLYGREFQVLFHARLRPERRFEGIEALKAQIARDAQAARAIHAGAGRMAHG